MVLAGKYTVWILGYGLKGINIISKTIYLIVYNEGSCGTQVCILQYIFFYRKSCISALSWLRWDLLSAYQCLALSQPASNGLNFSAFRFCSEIIINTTLNATERKYCNITTQKQMAMCFSVPTKNHHLPMATAKIKSFVLATPKKWDCDFFLDCGLASYLLNIFKIYFL